MFKTNILGLECKNPIVIASGPWMKGLSNIKKAIESGAGAVFTETIVSEEYPNLTPMYAYDNEFSGLENIKSYSGKSLEEWVDDLNYIYKEKRFGQECLIIASIMASSSSELAYIAKKIEKTGVDGIEIGLSCPMGECREVLAEDSEIVYAYTKEVVDSVNIPVSVKLSHSVSDLTKVVKAIEKAGGKGISAINTIRCILNIDIETLKPSLQTYGGYSGPPIKPIGLSTVAMISQSTKLPITGMGGIQNHKNLLEYIMVGAQAGAMGTNILINGYSEVNRIIKDLEEWINLHPYESIEDIKGAAINEIKAFEELKVEPKKVKLNNSCYKNQCKKCIVCCFEDAIAWESNKIVVDIEKCIGCGMCCTICPGNVLSLGW